MAGTPRAVWVSPRLRRRRYWGACPLLLALSLPCAAPTPPDLCGGVSVYIYRNLPPPFPNFIGLDVLDVPIAKGDGSAPTMELGVPCEFTKYGCERVQNWGKGPTFPDERLPDSLVQAGVHYSDVHQNSLSWLFLGHLVAHCEVTNPEEAQLFYVPYPIMSLLRASVHSNITVPEVDAHYAVVKDFLREQPGWQRCDGCDHIITLEAPSDRHIKFRVQTWGGYYHEDRFWSRAFRLGHHHGTLSSEMNAKYTRRIKIPFNVPVMTVPYTLGFLPKSDAQVDAWLDYAFTPALPRKPGSVLMVAPRPHRVDIIRLCEEKATPCTRIEASGVLYFRLYREYTYSIQPGGDTPTRRAFFDSLLSGTIPIVFDPRSRVAGRTDGFKENEQQHYRYCYAKYFSETPWGDEWLDKVALVARNEADAMRLVQDTSAARIAEIQANIREIIPRLLFWDHTAAAAVTGASHHYSNVSMVPTALRLMARDVAAAANAP